MSLPRQPMKVVDDIDRFRRQFGNRRIGRSGLNRAQRGGSKRYLQLRDHLRAAAIRHGWKAPEPTPPAQLTPIAGRATANTDWAGEVAPEPEGIAASR